MLNEPVHFPQLAVVNLAAEGAASTSPYRNVVVNRVNESCLRLSAFEGDYRWHLHPESDELFVVVDGQLAIDLAGGTTLTLGPWDMVTIPAGMVHRTRALPRDVNLCVEHLHAETVFVEPPVQSEAVPEDAGRSRRSVLSAIDIARATAEADFDGARVLFREYAAWLGVDLGFQGFEAELNGLDRIYAPPSGSLLLARDGSDVAGCVAVRPLSAVGVDACEMKRLYVRPAYRGRGLGRHLAEAIMEEGRRLGYSRMALDSLEQMRPAQALYRALGFEEVDPYYDNPLAGTTYMMGRL